jgi:hypothetical protein
MIDGAPFVQVWILRPHLKGLKEWFGLTDFDLRLWTNFDYLEDWWCHISGAHR